MDPNTAATVIIDSLGAMRLKAADDDEFLDMVTDETWKMRKELGLVGDTNWPYAVEEAIRGLLGIEHTRREPEHWYGESGVANESAIKLTRNTLRSLIKEELTHLTESRRRQRFVGASPGDQPERGFPTVDEADADGYKGGGPRNDLGPFEDAATAEDELNRVVSKFGDRHGSSWEIEQRQSKGHSGWVEYWVVQKEYN